MSGRLLLKREEVPRRQTIGDLRRASSACRRRWCGSTFSTRPLARYGNPLSSWAPVRSSPAAGNSNTAIPRGLPEKLIEPALYSYLSLKVIYQFQSKYALILYETLKRFADRDAAEPYWPVKTSQLRDLLGCRDKLANWQLFRRRALDPAVAEINELSGFVVELMEIRQGSGRGGGKVVSAVFHIRRKSSEEARTAVREIEKPRLQRRGERKTKQADDLAARAIRWLEGSDISTRRKWCERAQELGVQVPRAGTAKENLHKWVPSIAPLLAEEENVR